MKKINIKLPKKKKGNNKTRKRKIFKIILLAFLSLCIIGLATAGAFLGYVVTKAPDFKPEELYDAEPSILYDKDGVEYAKLGNKIRSLTSFDKLPESLVDAIVATEDSRFFQHNGFDLPRFMMASFKQALGNSDAGGASTLTMQLSKNKITVKESEGFKGFDNIIRKFTDIYMAVFKIEKAYTKEEIIEFYVNSNYMGADTNGVEDASQTYFGKSVTDLNLAEAAMIAGIFNAPGYYDPYIHPEACEQRRETVLYLMKRHNYINDDEYKAAMELTVDKLIKPKKETADQDFQSFIYTVVDETIEKTGLNPYEVPMKIYTTMDRNKQQHVENILAGTYPGYKWQNDVVQAGIAVLSAENGSIAAIGAGRNRVARGLNFATELTNQIGSTAKPLYEYALGIEKLNWNTGQIFVDEPWGYTNGDDIKNWDLKYEGFVNMRTALVESRNIPALKAFQEIDNKTRTEWINSLGLHPEIEDGIIHEAHALGGYNGESPLSLAAAYNAFASKGYYVKPYSITKIEFADGRDNYEYKYTMNRVMSKETAWMTTNLLISVARGTGFAGYNVNGVTYAGKSGTTNLDKETIQAWHLPSKAVDDLWAVGFTDKYTIATWYGYENRSSEYYNVFGSGQNYRIFTAVAKGVFTEQSNFEKPEGVVAVETEIGCYEACLPSEFTPSHMRTTEYFKKGYEPTTVSDRYAKLDNVTNLKANTSGSTVELTWNAIKTPHALDMDYLNAYFSNAYKNADWASAAATTRYNENLSGLGTIIYKVYEKVGGNLKLVATTSDTKVKVTASTNNPTFVVKTSYTVFQSNMSDGTTITANGASAGNLVTAKQNVTQATVSASASKLNNEANIATVSVNGIPVDSSKVSYQYALDKNKPSGSTYTIEVKVVYDKQTIDTFKIKITVQ